MQTSDTVMKRVMSYLFSGLVGTTVGFMYLANTIA